jgi:hypothetical protein
LEAGKRELSAGKKEYEQAKDNQFLVLADKLLKGGTGFEEAREQIAEETSRWLKERARLTLGKGDLRQASWKCAGGGNS